MVCKHGGQNALAITAPTQKAGFRVRKDSFVVNQTLVFQIKFCGKNPALRVAAKRLRLARV
jgi:hypothetical protein